MPDTPSQELRQAAADMRAKHGPDHIRHTFWCALADWLDAAAATAERTEAEGAFVHQDSHALKVARAYLGSTNG